MSRLGRYRHRRAYTGAHREPVLQSWVQQVREWWDQTRPRTAEEVAAVVTAAVKEAVHAAPPPAPAPPVSPPAAAGRLRLSPTWATVTFPEQRAFFV